MGKIRRARKTYHLQAAHHAEAGEKSNSVINSKKHQDERLEVLPKAVLPVGNLDAAMFKNLKIDIKNLVQSLPDSDPTPVVSLKQQTNKTLPKMHKKEKMKLRRVTFLNKIQDIMTSEKEAKATKKRQKTAIVGDVRPLADALPKIDLPKPSSVRTKPTKIRPVKKFKARQMQMMKDVLAFKQVCNHPSFKQDPQGTILDHLQNKLKELT